MTAWRRNCRLVKENKAPSPHRLAGVLGMCRRAGRLTTGFDAVAALLTQSGPLLVMTAADISPKSRKELEFAIQKAGRPAAEAAEILPLPLTKETAGRALGVKKPVGILATQDPGFASAIRRACPGSNDTEEERGQRGPVE